MWNRLMYYCELARRDVWRFKSASCLQALIVAGVCFPVLILLALKRGHVEDLRRELVTSPTGRLIKIYPASAGRPFTREELPSLARDLGPVEIAIPNARRLVELSAGKESVPIRVDVYATTPGDPILRAQGGDILTTGEEGIVLNRAAANALGLEVGQDASLSVLRTTDMQRGSVELAVRAIIPASSEDKIAFVDSVLIDRIGFFQRNGGVEEWGWGALPSEPPERYPVFLLVNDLADPLSTDDLNGLAIQGFTVEPAQSEIERTLGGAIREDARESVAVYRLTRAGSATVFANRMSDKWWELGNRTLATDAVVPWCEPRTGTLDGRKVSIIGLTLPPRCKWLHKWLVSLDLPFERTASSQQGRIPAVTPAEIGVRLEIPLGDKDALGLTVTPVAISEPADPGDAEARMPAIGESEDGSVFVPCRLLAMLDEHGAGLATWDPETNQISGVVGPSTYEDALLFAATIDDVPRIVANAVQRGFPYNAENARIEEIQQQDGSLQKLVLIVGLLVFSFGVFTVFGVLWESTARKRSTIGIMRVMGVTPRGAFVLVMLRALMLGAVAGGLTIGAGWLSVILLTWTPPMGHFVAGYKPVISAFLDANDVALVLMGSLTCCALGALAPGFAAGRLDPFEALVQGRFR